MRSSIENRLADLCIKDSGTGCWLWTGAIDSGGYARISVAGKNATAHRVSYELANGAIATGLQIDHLCRIRHCVNPAHLEAVSPRVNTLRSTAVTAVNAIKTECPLGHSLSGDNLLLEGRWRRCRICRTAQNRARTAAYEARKRSVA